MGAKKAPFYRISVADSASPRDGRFIEHIGYYNPMTEPATIKIDKEKALAWLSDGAQPTQTVKDIFRREGVALEQTKKPAKKPRVKKKKEPKPLKPKKKKVKEPEQKAEEQAE